MCGRFSLIADSDTISKRFDVDNLDQLHMSIRYNIAPGQDVLAVVNANEKNKAGFLKWGLVPSWAKDSTIGYKMINARAETIDQKPSFKGLLQRRRCLVIADSFFEWKKSEGKKQPTRILLKSEEPFAFAGLWDRWEKEGNVITSCTIITTSPNSIMKDIHDRMPVILSKKQEKLWLNREIKDPVKLKKLLLQYPPEEMMVHPVAEIVNSAKNDLPECIANVNVL